MVIFQSINYDVFIERYWGRNIVLYGAGRFLDLFLQNQKEKVWLCEKIKYIVDKSKEREGKEYFINNRFIKVISLERFLANMPEVSNCIFILTVSPTNTMDVLHYLDGIKQLSNATFIYGERAAGWGLDFQPQPSGQKLLPSPSKKYDIPKQIHYCWFGDKPFSETNIKCINSWKTICPEYKLILWNEENYDLLSTPDYVQQAYKLGKYAFVSDYVRLDVVNKYGGVYLDTDVLLLKPLDGLLKYKAIYAYMIYNEIATGLGFASVAGNDDLRNMLNMYSNIQFEDPNGNYNTTPCPRFNTDYFRLKGIRINNSVVMQEDSLFLSSDYLCSLDPVQCSDGNYHLALYALTPNSIGIHLCENSWKSTNEQSAFGQMRKYLKDINERLLIDWKREYT